jgi:DICT domain-containing protein
MGQRLLAYNDTGSLEHLKPKPEPPAERPVHAAFRRDPRDTTPFQLLSEGCEVRRASRALLTGLSRRLEDQARALGRSAVLVGAFEADAPFDAAARRRYADLARELAFCGAVGTGMPDEPAAGVRGGRLHASDPLAREWTVALVSPHASAALTASDPGAGDGRYDYALTHDRELAAAAAAALMARIAP